MRPGEPRKLSHARCGIPGRVERAAIHPAGGGVVFLKLADERAILAVLEYFSKNKSKLKQGKLTNGTFVHGVQFLSRHEGNTKMCEPLSTINSISIFWKALIVGEHIELQKRIPEVDRKIEEASKLLHLNA